MRTSYIVHRELVSIDEDEEFLTNHNVSNQSTVGDSHSQRLQSLTKGVDEHKGTNIVRRQYYDGGIPY